MSNKPFLTIGMATFDDFHGVYFSIQALRMYHPEVMDDTEILIIDNNPKGEHGKQVKKFSGWAPNVRYIPEEQWVSTAVRNKIFEEAKGECVISMDCHIFFELGSLKKLIDFYKAHPDDKNLYQGPLVYDNLTGMATHFDPVWREQMYGIWANDPRGKDPDGEPFEIPMQGLGVFSCRKDARLGFNPLFKGFGGEEGYIHEKYRQAGHKAMCLPFLRWIHRFGRPDGVKYPLTLNNKLRNYFLGHAELGLDTKPIIDHFKEWTSEENLIRLEGSCKQELIDNQIIK